MKKVKKIIKVIIISLCLVFGLAALSFSGYYHFVTHGVSLDTNKIDSTKNTLSLKIYDKNMNVINSNNNKYIEINKLNSHTKNAFISAEDKRFYKHKGIDYIRIGGAVISNIKSKKFSEGASTISQQLIKNTLLSNEKTINRKVKEFKLARELEKHYQKDEILELYLNNIYFGNGNYGIENASNYYFGKSASKLTLSESCLLAGIINAPTFYNLQSNFDKAIERRNLILTLMKNQNKITSEDFESAKNEKINLNITKKENNNFIFNEILSEACLILNKTENEIKNSNIEIFTNYDLNLKHILDKNIINKFSELKNYNVATFLINNKNGLIEMTYGNTKTLNSKKQPGSTIKPILVYAPALEKNIVSPATKILDESINISGYSPENADHKYHGFVSVRECVKNSYNVPAVKLLNEIGIKEACSYAENMNISFTKDDNNLAIALGGFTEGITLKQLADSYSTFANLGSFNESSYISKITNKNKILYSKELNSKQIFSDSTAYLLTDMLIETSKSGTAKKLKDMPFEVASKTGTVGKVNSNKNTDAFCVSYTSNHTIVSYIGNESLNQEINGASYPTLINKEILLTLYKNQMPENFKKPASVKNINLDTSEYTNNKIIENNNLDNSFEEIFSKNNLPEKNVLLNSKIEVFNFENRKPIITFFANKNYTYKIKRIHKNKEETLSSLSPNENLKTIKYEDISAKNNEIYEYFVEICEKSTNKITISNKVKLKSY